MKTTYKVKTPYNTYYVGDEAIVTTIGPKTIAFTLREYKRVDNNQSLYILDTDIRVDDTLIESITTEGQGFLTFSEVTLRMHYIYVANTRED